MKSTTKTFASFLIGSVAVFPILLTANTYAMTYDVEPSFPNIRFNQPLFLTAIPDKTNSLVVVEQGGRVHAFENSPDVKSITILADISDKIRTNNSEEGLLGLAFHPNFQKNRQVFLHYSASDPRRNVISRFNMNKAGNKILRGSEKVILEVKQPYGNHNGGMLDFGPDGYLYISLGDGGAAGDPKNHGQNLSTLLGAILRIDVDKPEAKRNYGIPPDNPFKNNKKARAEIWAYGLRNVWRFSFDQLNGQLWAADVGQTNREEVNIIHKGGNYGWNYREGFAEYRSLKRGKSLDQFEEPVLDLKRDVSRSITGGYVYHGKKLPGLKGAYVYGDFVTGNIWAYFPGKNGNSKNKLIAKGEMISSFGQDDKGEIYFTSYTGSIYQLISKNP